MPTAIRIDGDSVRDSRNPRATAQKRIAKGYRAALTIADLSAADRQHFLECMNSARLASGLRAVSGDSIKLVELGLSPEVARGYGCGLAADGYADAAEVEGLGDLERWDFSSRCNALDRLAGVHAPRLLEVI